MSTQQLQSIFVVGALIYDNYWAHYSKVLSFDTNPSKLKSSNWSVTVVTCNKDGVVAEGERERTHCTYPSITPHQPHIYPK